MFAAVVWPWVAGLGVGAKQLVLKQRSEFVVEKRAVVTSTVEAPSKHRWGDGLSASATLQDVVLLASEFLATASLAVDDHFHTLATRERDLVKACGASNDEPPTELVSEVD